MVKRRGRKKGPSLVYQFQRSMESGDASDKEAPPSDPKSNNLMQKEWLKAISRVVEKNCHQLILNGHGELGETAQFWCKTRRVKIVKTMISLENAAQAANISNQDHMLTEFKHICDHAKH